MPGAHDDRIAGLLAQGWSLLAQGRPRDAADVFSRVLLQDPGHDEARKGLAQSQRAATETDRLLEARLEEAETALGKGDLAAARALLEDVVRQGGNRDRAAALLDRLDTRGGRLQEGRLGEGAPPEESAEPTDWGRPAWSRLAFTVAWMAAFGGLAAGVVSSWESLLSRLTRAPLPRSDATPPSIHLPPPSKGERAVADARRLMEQGNAAGALAALDQVSPEEPVYPLARQLRSELESALRAGRARR